MQSERFEGKADTTLLSSDSPEVKKTAELIRGGLVYLASGNPTLAKMLFLRAIDQNPNSSEAYIGLGEIDYKVGNFVNAYFNFEKASTLAPDNIHAMVGKARAMRQHRVASTVPLQKSIRSTLTQT